MHMELINNTFIPEKRYHVAAGLPEGKHSCKLSETCLPAGIISGDSWILTVSTRSAGARPTSTNPHGENGSDYSFVPKNPIAILRDDYRSNRSNLLNKWETSSLNRIQMELVRMGSMPIQNKDRHTFKALNSIEKKIKQLQEYEGCPDMSHEKQLLATYKYILSSPLTGSSEDCHPMRF